MTAKDIKYEIQRVLDNIPENVLPYFRIFEINSR